MRRSPEHSAVDSRRITTALLVLAGIFIIFTARLFYVQIIRGSYYQSLADDSQRKKYEIAPERGQIYILDGEDGEVTPLVLNETRYTIYVDPRFIDDSEQASQLIAEVTGGEASVYAEKASNKERAYVVLERRITKQVADSIRELELRGVGLQEEPTRIHPYGSLAAQTVGFVNDEGQGQYGVEQGLNSRLAGSPGLLSGITDVRGIPIASKETQQTPAVAGEDIVLTLDKNVQGAAEFALKNAIEKTKAPSGSIVVIDPSSGAIRAMANYPTFDPGEFRSAAAESFNNPIVSRPYEQGSVIKIFAMAAALQEKIVTPESTYYDQSRVRIDDFTIRNSRIESPQVRTMTQVITHSVNTGMIYILERLSGDNNSDISREDKEVLHRYYHDKFKLDVATSIGVSGEFASELPSVTSSDVRFANMTFGQGMTNTMMRTIASASALVNGGVYYEPYLVHGSIREDGSMQQNTPKVLDNSVVSPEVSKQIRSMMSTVIEEGSGRVARRTGYVLGGKTGTAQIANPEGGYYEDRTIGTFLGVGPGESPKYLVMVRVDEPKVAGFAGSSGAAPVFKELNDWLIEYYAIPPAN